MTNLSDPANGKIADFTNTEVFRKSYDAGFCHGGKTLDNDQTPIYTVDGLTCKKWSADSQPTPNMPTVVKCAHQRPKGYERCGQVTFNGIDYKLSCPDTHQKCCKKRGYGGNRFESRFTGSDLDKEFEGELQPKEGRCEYYCHDEDVVKNDDGTELDTGLEAFAGDLIEEVNKVIIEARVAADNATGDDEI